uniref:LSDAT_euk domain-containing protein n=1 Tax=Parastrongyloides trichosuri TaxID=131310 RepID=A0A0N4ZFJ0_PARTI
MNEDTIHHTSTINEQNQENDVFLSYFTITNGGENEEGVSSYHRNNMHRKKFTFKEEDSLAKEFNEKMQNCWIEKTFKKRECIKFIPSVNENDKCCCGNYSSAHSHKALSRFTTAVINKKYPKTSNNKKWNILEHTEVWNTDAYGTIEFQGGNHAHKAYYCRIGFDSNPKDILYLLEKIWKLEAPNLIITIHGGMTNFEVQQKLGKVFREGLLKAAQTTGAWIITSGVDSGVVRHVAKALDDAGISARMRSKIILLGIAPFGLLSNREKFVGKNIVVPLDHQSYGVRNRHTMLNDRHSYFLLVDNGTVGRYGADMVLRKRFENYLSQEEGTEGPPKRIPIICVVLEGGICTLESVLQYLTSKPPCPVIVCDGSGRVSDLLAFAQKNVLSNGSLSCSVRSDMENLIRKIFNADKNTAFQILNNLMKCVNQKDLLTIYRYGEEGEKDVDYAILTAILRGQKLTPMDQLYLALSWNRVDIARNHIFEKNKEFSSSVLYSILMDALLFERVDFVKLLFENGVNLSKFLTISRLEVLYNFDKQEILSLLQFLIGTQAESKRYKNLTLFDIGIIIEKLMGNAYRSNYTTRRFKPKNGNGNNGKTNPVTASNSKVNSCVFDSVNCSTNSICINSNNYKNGSVKETDFGGKKNYIIQESEILKEEVDFVFPFNELMIWVILTKRHELAKFLWQYGEEAMARSLIAIRLYKGMAKVASDDYTALEVSTILREHANDFKKLSLELLEHCYQQDDRQTRKMLTTELPNWGHHTCLSLAFLANNKEFLAHPCCQVLLAELWYGGLRFRSQSNIKVIAAVLFPPTILLLDFKSSACNLPNNISSDKHSLNVNDNLSDTTKYTNKKRECIVENGTDDDNYFRFPSREHLGQKRRSVVSLTYNSLFSEGQWGWRKLLGRNTGKEPDIKNVEEDGKVYNSYCNLKNNNAYVECSNYEKKINNQEKLTNGEKFQHWIILLFYKFLLFYRAPITSFWIWAISFVIFLTTLTFVLLIELPTEPSMYEWYIFVYVVSITLEHLRKLLTLESSSVMEKIRVFYNTTYWHILTATAIITYFFGFAFRMHSDMIHTHGRIILAVNSVLWHMKLFDFLSVHPKIGPYITMAGKMVLNMSYIIVMLLVTLMAFGLSRQAIIYPHEKFNWLLVRNIFYKPYFMLYGEVYAGEIDTCGDEGTNCVPGGWIPPIIMTIFLLVANILLINMLIAIFNNIFTITNAMSQQVWMFQRYSQVLEYDDTPIIPPPFTPLIHLYLAIRAFATWSVRKKDKMTKATGLRKVKDMMPFAIKVHVTKDELRRVHDFEEDCMDDLCRKKNNLIKKNCENNSSDNYYENLELMTGKMIELINENRNLKNNLNKLQEDLKNIEENQRFMVQMVIQNREKRRSSENANDIEIKYTPTLEDIEDPDSENDEHVFRSRVTTIAGDKMPARHHVLPQYTSITDGLSNKLRLREWHKLSLSRYGQLDDQLGNEANFDINVNEIKSSSFLSDMQDMMKINDDDEDNLYFNPPCPKVISFPLNATIETTPVFRKPSTKSMIE